MNPSGVLNVSFFLCKRLHKSPITIKGSHFSPPLWRELNKCFEEKLNTAYGINCNGRRNLLVGLIRDRLHGESHPETTITLLTCDDHCDVSDHGGQGGGAGHVSLINAGPDEMLSVTIVLSSLGGRGPGGREEHLARGL